MSIEGMTAWLFAGSTFKRQLNRHETQKCSKRNRLKLDNKWLTFALQKKKRREQPFEILSSHKTANLERDMIK
ncbi:CLUMA_CG011307, isoform A [Clunio marinus]|uniref:CLUMA_CG011307, isoform A n=1 Tax=Clunio marinus TaxID=568069 RepID=A0A1J1IFW9_9DIPT|nr:CLUMA_CG011307, isoform A [Clunio marinus]